VVQPEVEASPVVPSKVEEVMSSSI
jgi:hypothetical protein